MKPALLASTLAALLGLTATAWAAEKAGVTFPDTVSIEGKTLTLNGLGIREATVLNVDVYVAGLYLEKKSADPEAILAAQEVKYIHLHFVRDVDKGDIVNAFKEGFKKNGGDMNALNERLNQLSGWLADMKKSTVMAFAYAPGKGTTVAIKGQVKGTIPGDDFGRAIFANFIGKSPPNAGLKNGLLGK